MKPFHDRNFVDPHLDQREPDSTNYVKNLTLVVAGRLVPDRTLTSGVDWQGHPLFSKINTYHKRYVNRFKSLKHTDESFKFLVSAHISNDYWVCLEEVSLLVVHNLVSHQTTVKITEQITSAENPYTLTIVRTNELDTPVDFVSTSINSTGLSHDFITPPRRSFPRSYYEPSDRLVNTESIKSTKFTTSYGNTSYFSHFGGS